MTVMTASPPETGAPGRDGGGVRGGTAAEVPQPGEAARLRPRALREPVEDVTEAGRAARRAAEPGDPVEGRLDRQGVHRAPGGPHRRPRLHPLRRRDGRDRRAHAAEPGVQPGHRGAGRGRRRPELALRPGDAGEDERALLQVRDPEGDLAGGGEPVPGGPVRPALELRQVEAFGDAAPGRGRPVGFEGQGELLPRARRADLGEDVALVHRVAVRDVQPRDRPLGGRAEHGRGAGRHGRGRLHDLGHVGALDPAEPDPAVPATAGAGAEDAREQRAGPRARGHNAGTPRGHGKTIIGRIGTIAHESAR
ncbi:hypothetical protein [Actinomadura madurae]|uniref:hypothetical protein n=1 Tax=Actinomadura madurae TaxID=1993 RepID=UPI003FD76344